MNLSPFSGEQIVQVTNPDPFAKPVLRSPVLHTPVWMIATRAAVPAAVAPDPAHRPAPGRHLIVAVLVLAWRMLGWPGPVITAGRHHRDGRHLAAAWPDSWTRLVVVPAVAGGAAGTTSRRWPAVMTISRLAVHYRGRLLLPVLGPVTSTGYTDRLHVRLVSGQSADDFARRAGKLAHAFGALACRIRTAEPGAVVVELVRRDALAAIIPALPVPARADLTAVPVGRHEDGTPWSIRLHGTHVLLAGSTGAGKGVAAVGHHPRPAARPRRRHRPDTRRGPEADGTGLRPGPVRPVRPLRIRPGGRSPSCSKTPSLACRTGPRNSPGGSATTGPRPEHPFTVMFVDEVAFLTAYQPDRKLRDRTMAALATLTTQGRAVGYCVVAALQDPRKDVLTIRNLFPDRIAMRLDEPEQADMVLGDGSRDRGATADLISADPATGAGIAYVRLETDPDPVRVRAAWVSDDDITAMCRQYADPRPRSGCRWPSGRESRHDRQHEVADR